MTEPVDSQSAEWVDPIVAEVRAARAALWAASGHDIREFCRRVRLEQAESGHPVVPSPAVSMPEAMPPSKQAS